jgi:dolichyl-phosphate-mannose--protein O-mannosyl transferase
MLQYDSNHITSRKKKITYNKDIGQTLFLWILGLAVQLFFSDYLSSKPLSKTYAGAGAGNFLAFVVLTTWLRRGTTWPVMLNAFLIWDVFRFLYYGSYYLHNWLHFPWHFNDGQFLFSLKHIMSTRNCKILLMLAHIALREKKKLTTKEDLRS